MHAPGVQRVMTRSAEHRLRTGWQPLPPRQHAHMMGAVQTHSHDMDTQPVRLLSLGPMHLQPHRSRLGLWRTGRERQVWLQMRAEAHATGTVNAVTYCSAVLCDRSAHLVPCPEKHAVACSCSTAAQLSWSIVMRAGWVASGAGSIHSAALGQSARPVRMLEAGDL